jgi:uncharacterized RDD family membrane protein YckC
MSCPRCGTENPAGNRFCMKCGTTMTNVADLTQHAGIGARIGSSFIDFLVISAALIVAVIAAMIVGMILGAIHLPTLGVLVMVLILLMCTIGTVVYYPYFWVTRAGQTIGMKAMHIKVVRTDGGAVTVGPAIMRAIGMYVIDSIVLGIPLGVLWCLWDAKKQCWHDKMANTVVVRA